MKLLRASELYQNVGNTVVIVSGNGETEEVILGAYLLDSENKKHRITGIRTSDQAGVTFDDIKEVRLVQETGTSLKATELTMGEERHKWTSTEVQASIELHLCHREHGASRDQAIEKLAQKLELPESKVRSAVDAVGTVDPADPRKAPQASKMLQELWAKSNG